MKISITFDTLQEGLSAISLLTGTGATVTTDDETGPAAAPGTPDPVLGVELDSAGFPWVAEVHAGTKNKNNDGTWKQKKGVTTEARQKAEREALAHLRATSSPAPVAAAPVVQTPMTMPNPGAVAPGLVPGLPAAVTLPPVSYEQLTELYGQLAGAGKIDAAGMIGIYTATGVNPADLATNETGRRAVYDALVQIANPAPAGMPGLPGA